MVEHNEDEINTFRQRIQFTRQPLPLRTGNFVQRTVEHKHQRIGRTDRVIAAVLQVGEALEIICQGDFFVAM